jgi:hypothetical protein
MSVTYLCAAQNEVKQKALEKQQDKDYSARMEKQEKKMEVLLRFACVSCESCIVHYFCSFLHYCASCIQHGASDRVSLLHVRNHCRPYAKDRSGRRRVSLRTDHHPCTTRSACRDFWRPSLNLLCIRSIEFY